MVSQWLSSAWQRSLILAALFAVVLFGMPLRAQAVGSTELIALTNNERAKSGLAPLNYDGRLASSAYAKARDMLAKGYWAHTSPDGTPPWHFVTQAGYGYATVGENLAKGFSSDISTVEAWMASTGHRANILNPAFNDIGIGVVSGVFAGEQIVIVVAHYGATAAVPMQKPVPKPAAPRLAAAPVKPAQISEVQVQTKPGVPSSAPSAQAAEPQRTKDRLNTFIESLIKIIQVNQEDLKLAV